MVQFGVQVSTAMCEMSDVCRVWPLVEDMGFDWISGQDHFYTLRAEGAGSFEGVACHAALAALTNRVRVGCLVYSAGYRHPAVFANSLVTIDHLSGGRLEVGIGAGWFEEEYRAYGIPFEPFDVRLRRMTETIEILRSLWANDYTDYDGEFYTLTNARCDPKPLQPMPRIWVGAKGPKALKAAARLGDGWNANFMSPDDFVRSCEVVKEHAVSASGPTIGATLPLILSEGEAFEQTLRDRYGVTAEQMRPATLGGSPAQVADKLSRYVDNGAEWVILAVRSPFDLDELERFATEVAPLFR
jgi:alkanesulfonate monooxygenase SsuD/methylene tetrahydromethanopterin reductase-like flavin-dependent oxidoreductase (luciferase family)